VIQDVLELRIIEQDLWDAVKARQAETTFSQPEGETKPSMTGAVLATSLPV